MMQMWGHYILSKVAEDATSVSYTHLYRQARMMESLSVEEVRAEADTLGMAERQE